MVAVMLAVVVQLAVTLGAAMVEDTAAVAAAVVKGEKVAD